MQPERFGTGNTFTDVDRSNAPEMISYLDRVTDFAIEGKRASYAALQLEPGTAVLDAGCGTGDDVRMLCELVGKNGHVWGIDASQAMVDEAIDRGLPANADIRQASVYALPFPEGTFDRARAERVFQHLEDPQAGARELFRVLKPGGILMIMDQDWETLIVAGSQKPLTRRICNALADHFPNGWAGRNLCGLLRRTGFHDVAVRAIPFALPFPIAMQLVFKQALTYAMETHAVSAHDAAAWTADLQMADESGEFYCSFTFFAATGRR
jgi:ubiquinone/menaquinone biosynthesis C-methylase UbiE